MKFDLDAATIPAEAQPLVSSALDHVINDLQRYLDCESNSTDHIDLVAYPRIFVAIGDTLMEWDVYQFSDWVGCWERSARILTDQLLATYRENNNE